MHKVEIENSSKGAWHGRVFIDGRQLDVVNVGVRWDPNEARAIVDLSVYADPLRVIDIGEEPETREPSLEEQLVGLLSAHAGEAGGSEGAVDTLRRLLEELKVYREGQST